MNRACSLVVALVVAAAAACGGDTPQPVAPPACPSPTGGSFAVAPADIPDRSPHDALFQAAADEFDVPVTLLRAISYLETRWQMVEGHEEFEGVPAAHGLMALRGARLTDAAHLIGAPETLVRRDARANVRAAAALLHAYAEVLGIRAGDIAAWDPVVARYSGIEVLAGRESYVREVESVRLGRRSMPEPARSASATDDCGTTAPPAVVDRSGAAWRPSPNFNQRMTGDRGRIHMVIIHSCEGGYIGCWSWLANVESQVSAHYVVREDGAEVTQLVREAARAWHIGATYDSTRNAGHDGHLHGTQSNHFTIGVEHAGYASQVTWPVAQLEASAKLVCDVARRWGIPRDRLHIVSHGQLQPYNRTDPGKNWPWEDYLARIDRHCAV